MNSVGLQFHATWEELHEFAHACSDEFGLHLVYVFPTWIFRVTTVLDTELDGSWYPKITLHRRPPDLAATSGNNFMDRNEGAFVFQVGGLIKDTLQESSFSCIPDDQETYKLAKEIVKKLKKITKAGSIGVSEKTGKEYAEKAHRYTKGARKLYDSGKFLRQSRQFPFHYLPCKTF